jgi:hypothetical protein
LLQEAKTTHSVISLPVEYDRLIHHDLNARKSGYDRAATITESSFIGAAVFRVINVIKFIFL